MEGEKISQVAVVMVPIPAQGHMTPVLHLSHLIISSYGMPVHWAGSAIHNRQAKLRLQGWDPETSRKIEFHNLLLPPYSSPPPNPNIASTTRFPTHLQPLFDASTHLREPMFHLLQELSTKCKRIVIIHDFLMSSVVQDVKLIPNAEAYTISAFSAFTLFFTNWEAITEKPFQLDSDIPSSIPSSEHCFTREILMFIAKQLEFRDFQSGSLFNSCRLLEGRYLELLQRLPLYAKGKIFTIGPFNPMDIKSTSTDDQKQKRHKCLEWLDKQEANSVIYVSFGTSTSMTDEEITELAKGLEGSGHKFLWVHRAADKGGDVFAGDDELEASQELPEGYEERVKNRGMVVRDWAPQLEILGHPSIGGFMSHCGWNSVMESIAGRVPMAAWPMHSDQPKNATVVTQVLRIGIMVRDWEHQAELVTSNAIEDVVKRLMASNQGEEMRKRVGELCDAVRASVADGGASRLEMDSFIAHITR